ncbi:MAG: hypothetical protein ABI611_05045 [Solirubrobacteraceae bacterium]
MLNSSQFTRSAVIAATMISLGASPAMARPAEQPARSKTAVTTVANHTRSWTQPRVDGTGVRPADRPAVSAAPAVPLTRAADASGSADWLLIALAASTMLALLMVVALVPAVRHRAHSFRQV